MVVELGTRKLGFEVKFSSATAVTKGFGLMRADVGVTPPTSWRLCPRGGHRKAAAGLVHEIGKVLEPLT